MQAQLFRALSFTKAADGHYDQESLAVVASTSAEAAQILRANYTIRPDATVYLQTDFAKQQAVDYGAPLDVFVCSKASDFLVRPTEVQHHAWVRVMTNPSREDGVLRPAVYRRIRSN